jgi:predicted O-methyltransferase YrrM
MSDDAPRVWTRRWVLGAVLCWSGGVLAFAVLAPVDLSMVVVLLALGPLVAGVVQARRDHQVVLRRLERHAAILERLAASGRSAHAELAEAIGRVEALSAQLVAKESLTRADLTEALKANGADVITRTRKGVAVDLLLTYRQLEALHNLYATAGVNRPMPPTRGWASSPDLLLLLANLVERGRPSLIVECGSGTSTVWLAMMLRRFEIKGRLVALEHDAAFVERARGLVDQHELADYVDVRYAPLEPVRIGSECYPWYSRAQWEDLHDIDLLFVDGPPGEVGRHARLPALPLLADHLHAEAVVVLDDLIRTDEQEVLEEWQRMFPSYEVERVRLEKNAAVLRRRPAPVSPEGETVAGQPDAVATGAGMAADSRPITAFASD